MAIHEAQTAQHAAFQANHQVHIRKAVEEHHDNKAPFIKTAVLGLSAVTRSLGVIVAQFVPALKASCKSCPSQPFHVVENKHAISQSKLLRTDDHLAKRSRISTVTPRKTVSEQHITFDWDDQPIVDTLDVLKDHLQYVRYREYIDALQQQKTLFIAKRKCREQRRSSSVDTSLEMLLYVTKLEIVHFQEELDEIVKRDEAKISSYSNRNRQLLQHVVAGGISEMVDAPLPKTRTARRRLVSFHDSVKDIPRTAKRSGSLPWWSREHVPADVAQRFRDQADEAKDLFDHLKAEVDSLQRRLVEEACVERTLPPSEGLLVSQLDDALVVRALLEEELSATKHIYELKLNCRKGELKRLNAATKSL